MAHVSTHPETDYDSFAAYGIHAAECESDLNWQTRELLESICSSVENALEDFTLDASEILS